MKHTIARILMAGSAAGGVLFAGAAAAIDWNVTGFVRQEIAYSISSTDNWNNYSGNPFADRIQANVTHASYGDGTNAVGATTLYNNGRTGPFSIGGVFSAGQANAGGANYFAGANGLFSGAASRPLVGGAGTGALAAGANTSSPLDGHFGRERSIVNGAGGFGRRYLVPGDNGVMFPGVLFRTQNGLCGSVTNAVAAANPNCNAGAAGAQPLDDYSSESLDHTNFNMFNSRVEVDVQAKINREWSAYAKFRAYFDGTRNFTDGYTGDNFGSDIWGSRGTLAEWNSPDAIIDIPALYVDWNRGPLWVRFGNQTIAWGEAYFFRTTDVANGLDLRRHLTLGPGAEEYQDQRIASPGIRVSYTFNNGFELDMFAQLFSPTILPGQNSPYNLIDAGGAVVDDKFGMDDAEGAINYGAKLTMPLTDSLVGFVAYVNRRNPDGVFTSTDSPTVYQGLVNNGCVNEYNDTLNVLGTPVVFGGAGSGPGGNLTRGELDGALATSGIDPFPTLNTNARNMNRGCGSAFAPDARAPASLEYWDNVTKARMDQGNYLRQVIDEFPAAEWAVRDIFGFGQEHTFADIYRTIEGFRSSYGPFIQWIGRQFKRENIFMGGANYVVTTDDPESIFDQLIIRGEVAVTPNKKLMNDLSYDLKEVDDVVSALIFEKYHRISNAFPATYMVFQWMHRTSTDLFGRDLDKNDTPELTTFIDPVSGNFTAAAFDPEALTPRGTSSANYVVFAFQQPFPNLIWRFDMSILVDVAGGYLVQPGLRYRPAANWQWDLYATIIESPGADNDTITETLDFADEVFVRLTYYF